jgi:3-oxoacyl-[acyl-carrier protein] reductase
VSVPRRLLITGATRGIGRHLAEHYLALGDMVVGCGRGAATIAHPCYAHHAVDVTSEDAVAGMLSAIRAAHGGLDILINNAGAASMNAFLLTPPSTTRRIVDINVVAPMRLTHGAVRLMRRSGAARIVNLTTIAVPLRLDGEAVYAASKAAIESFTRIVAKELGPMGITCNAVGPSVIRTKLTEGVPAEKLKRLLAAQAVPREATAADVANVIDFFLKPESGLVTGQVVYLGGFS